MIISDVAEPSDNKAISEKRQELSNNEFKKTPEYKDEDAGSLFWPEGIGMFCKKRQFLYVLWNGCL